MLLHVTDPASERDLWLLHHIFLPRINADLALFRGQWNDHGLSTEHGKSPTQLYVLGMLHNHTGSLTAVRDIFDRHGVPAGISSTIQPPTVPADIAQILGRTRVDVPHIVCPLSEEQQHEITTSIDPLEPATDHGMSLYVNARQRLG